VNNIVRVEAMELLIEVMADLDTANLEGQRAFDIINNERLRNKSGMRGNM